MPIYIIHTWYICIQGENATSQRPTNQPKEGLKKTVKITEESVIIS